MVFNAEYTARQIEELDLMRNKLIAGAKKNFTDNDEEDYWPTKEEVMNSVRRTPLLPTAIMSHFAVTFSTGIRDVLKESPLGGAGTKIALDGYFL